MKTLILFSTILFSQLIYAASQGSSDEPPCFALINGDDVKLEKSPSGLYLIAIEDPHFDEYDVVIDITSSTAMKVRLAKFIPTSLVAGLKEELTKVSEIMQTEILKLAKARVIDGYIGFDSAGSASLTLAQGEDRLELFCSSHK